MTYSDFTIKKLKEQFGITEQRKDLNLNQQKLEASELLKDALKTAEDYISVRSEKARSELIVTPILIDLLKKNKAFFTIYSGDQLNVDKERGLVGECDFILAKNLNTIEISIPIITMVEAKKHDMDLGIPQCAAQMIGARLHNEKEGKKIEPIYGCVTTGDEWKFMKLEGNTIYSDKKKYGLLNLPELLGAFQTIIDYYKEHLN